MKTNANRNARARERAAAEGRRPRVIIESRYAAPLEETRRIYAAYLHDCLLDSLTRGEAPFASHALYPQVLNDAIPEERRMGMSAGFAWLAAADLVAVYMDFGVSTGMWAGLEQAKQRNLPIEARTLGGRWTAINARLESTKQHEVVESSRDILRTLTEER